MKNLNLFKTENDYKNYINYYELPYPSISFINDNEEGTLMIKREGLETVKVIASDIVLVNYNKEKIFIHYNDYNLNDYPKNEYTPIGVVVIPTSHDVYGDGSCGVMSLCEMSYSNPFNGIINGEKIYFGYNKSTVITSYSKAVSLGKATAQTETITASTVPCLPSNNVTGQNFTSASTQYVCQHDLDTHYCTSGVTCAPSPYLTDDSRNPNYYTTSVTNALSDFNGKENTEKYLPYHIVDDLSTATTVSNISGDTAVPAVACCYLYRTEGTESGDWYLPAIGELGYIMPKWNEIQNSLRKIKEIYGDDINCNVLKNGVEYWASTSYSSSNGRFISVWDGSVSYDNKSKNKYVRAFINLK